MTAVPLTPTALATRVAAAVAGLRRDHPVRVGIDGSPAAGKTTLADALVAPLRAIGRPVIRVRVDDFLQPRSIRFRHGRDDPDGYYRDHTNAAALVREVLTPLGPGGSGRYLPTLWEAAADRSTRAPYADAPADAVLVIDGPFLGRPDLAGGFDLVVLVEISPMTSRRRAPDQDLARAAWARYEAEVRPAERAHLIVRNNDVARPALVIRALPVS